jgi:membrane metallo-endopeptidase-like protein 1
VVTALQYNTPNQSEFIYHFRILTNENGYLANQLREQIDPRDWRTLLQAAEANARYEYLGNAITLPAAYLQGFLFDNLVPRYMNYGSIGWIIGHEITHGFDDQGRKFNYLGDLVDWWKPETAKKFEARAQCIIWQYGNYSIGQIEGKLNGIRTQGDDIADNGGIRQAYLAYGKFYLVLTTVQTLERSF